MVSVYNDTEKVKYGHKRNYLKAILREKDKKKKNEIKIFLIDDAAKCEKIDLFLKTHKS